MPRFSENPLSLSVPEEHFRAWASSTPEPDAADASQNTLKRTRSGRNSAYRGRSLAQLSVDDLLKQARPWKEFFGGATPAREFGVPRSRPEMVYKLSENIYEFIGNYLVIGLLCVVCVLYKRPVALVGILITSKAWDWLAKQEQERNEARDDSSARSSGGQPDGSQQQAQNQAAQTRPQQLAQVLVTAFTWVVLMLSNVVPAMFIAGFVSVCTTVLHALLRKPVPAARGRRR